MQQSLVALGRALDLKLGTWCITAMNKLALLDENDGLLEEKKRELIKALYNPLNTADAWERFTQRSAGVDGRAEAGAGHLPLRWQPHRQEASHRRENRHVRAIHQRRPHSGADLEDPDQLRCHAGYDRGAA